MLKFAGIFTGKFPKSQGQQIIFIKQNRWQAPLSSLWHCCFRNLQVQMLAKRWSFVHWDQYLLLVSHLVKIIINMSSFYDPVPWVYMCSCLWAFAFLLHFNKKIAGSNVISELKQAKKSHPIILLIAYELVLSSYPSSWAKGENWARVLTTQTLRSQLPQGRIDTMVELKKKWNDCMIPRI